MDHSVDHPDYIVPDQLESFFTRRRFVAARIGKHIQLGRIVVYDVRLAQLCRLRLIFVLAALSPGFFRNRESVSQVCRA